MQARVFVTLKKGVLDPQGKAVARSLGTLGYDDVSDVRLGKYVEIQLADSDPETARQRVAEMCKRLLANTVIEDYRIEIVPQE